MENNKFLTPTLDSIRRYSQNFPGVFKALVNETRLRAANILHNSYSQSGEDLVIDNLLDYKQNGFYVDVGAFDPNRYSNTKRFYLKNWRGINIEPNPKKHFLFEKLRSRDINLNIGISDKNNILNFFHFFPEALSTFSASESKRYINMGFHLAETIPVKVTPLADVLRSQLPSGQTIDLLSIDTEGEDYKVLVSNDWTTYHPRVVCVETFTSPGNPSPEYLRIHKFLSSKNYIKVTDVGLNTLFMENSTPNLNDIIKPKLSVKLKSDIPNFLPKLDKNKILQARIWDNKTYKVNPKTHIFTTIQEHFGNRLIHSLNIPNNGVVVDIGCFIGEKLWQLPQRKPYLGVGVDIAISSLRSAKEIDTFGHKFIAADLEKLPFNNQSIDQVLIFDVIEHITNAELGFSEVSRILKPGGKLLLHIPLKDNKWSLFWWKQQLFPNAALMDYKDVGHSTERMLSRLDIRKYLLKHNLIIEKEIPFNAFLVHFFDRELFKAFALLALNLFRSGKSLSNSNRTSHLGSVGVYRSIYGKYIIPVLEFLSFPDRLLEALGIGNSMFFLAVKNSQTTYYKNNNQYSEFLTNGKPEHFKVYLDEIHRHLFPNCKFLDVGCGTGIVVNEVARVPKTYAHGVEVSKSSVAIAKSQHAGNYSVYDGTNLPYQAASFDIVGSINVIEHVDDVHLFLTESLRVLKPGGHLIIGAPNFLTITSSYHYRMQGTLNKSRNILLTFYKLVRSFLGLQPRFSKFPPIVRSEFQPDDDAVNLINPVDLLMWGRSQNLELVKYWGAISPDYLSYKLRSTPLLNLLTGGVFIVFRKPV